MSMACFSQRYWEKKQSLHLKLKGTESSRKQSELMYQGIQMNNSIHKNQRSKRRDRGEQLHSGAPPAGHNKEFKLGQQTLIFDDIIGWFLILKQVWKIFHTRLSPNLFECQRFSVNSWVFLRGTILGQQGALVPVNRQAFEACANVSGPPKS